MRETAEGGPSSGGIQLNDVCESRTDFPACVRCVGYCPV